MMEKLLSPEGLADLIGVKPKTVINNISDIRTGKKLPSTLPPLLEVPGAGARFRPKDVEAWLESLKRKSPGRRRTAT